MKPEELKQLEKAVRIGGKGSTRRKHKHIPRPSVTGETRLRSSLQKLPLRAVNGIQQVRLSMQDGVQKVMYYPKVECSVQSNMYIISSESSEIILSGSEPDSQQLLPIKDAQSLSDLEHSSKKKEKKPRIRCRARNKAMKAASQPDLLSVTSCTSQPEVQPDPEMTGNEDEEKEEKPDAEDSADGNAGGDGAGKENVSSVLGDNDPKHLVSIFNSSEGVPVEELIDILSLEKTDTESSKENRLHFCSDSDSDLDQLLFGEKDSASKEEHQDQNEDRNQESSI